MYCENGYKRFVVKENEIFICDECGKTIQPGELYDNFHEEIFCEECI